MADEEDNRIKSTRTWIKWNNLGEGTSVKYGNKMFVKPEQSKQLIIEIKQRIKNNNAAASCKRSDKNAPKKTWVMFRCCVLDSLAFCCCIIIFHSPFYFYY